MESSGLAAARRPQPWPNLGRRIGRGVVWEATAINPDGGNRRSGHAGRPKSARSLRYDLPWGRL